MTEPIYTQDWISIYFPLWERLLPKTPNQRVLEIGCFEGRATRWFLENLPGSQLTCIDTFEGGQDHKELGVDFANVGDRFLHNVKDYSDRLWLYEGTSLEALRHLQRTMNQPYDVALIDGSHLAHDVLSDIVLTWPLVKQGGVVIFDDYGWHGGRPREQTPAPAIEAFLACYKGQYQLLEHGYQVVVRKL